MNEDDALGATIGGKIVLGGRVSARLGELLPLTPERLAAANPNAKRKPRKKRKPLFGSVVGILGQKKYKVHFDDGTERDCCSNNLKSHRQGASIPPEDTLQLLEGGFDAGGDTCPASLNQLEAIAASAAADASDALDEDEHLPWDDEIIQDILGLESSEEESSDDESRFDCPMSPVDFGINPYNDDVAVNNDVDDVMPSLASGVLLFSATTGAVTRNGGASAAAAATTTRNVGAAAVVGPNIDSPVGADAVQRFPSGHIKQRQERDCDIAVADLSYKQRLQSARARIARKIGHKVTVKQGSGRQKKEIEWEVVKEHVSTEENQQDREGSTLDLPV
jgi:hypothetical protein